MAAITKVKAHPVAPVAYEVNDKGVLTEDVLAGDLLTNGASGWSRAVGGTVEAHGIALMDGFLGQRGFSIGIQGEMDGYSGLTPGAALYPSATLAGGLDTTVVAGATIRVRATTTTRFRYNFV